MNLKIVTTIRRRHAREIIERLERLELLERRANARLSVLLDLAGARPSATIYWGPIVEQDESLPTRQWFTSTKEIRMKATQQVEGNIGNLKDRLGAPATLNGVPRFSSSDPAVVEVTDNGNGSFVAKAKSIGEAIIKAEGDASSDEGDQPFLATVAVQVTSGDVVEGTISLGAPTEQP